MKNSIQKIIDNFPNCCNTKQNKVATENGKRFEIKCSKNYYLKIHSDGCFVQDNSLDKCDYIFIRDYECKKQETEFYFVELKGSDIEKALQQIISTINHIRKYHIKTLSKEQILGFIVSSKVPKAGADALKLKQIFKKLHGKNLGIKNLNLIFEP